MTDHDGTYHQIYTDPLMVADLLVHFVNESWEKISISPVCSGSIPSFTVDFCQNVRVMWFGRFQHTQEAWFTCS